MAEKVTRLARSFTARAGEFVMLLESQIASSSTANLHGTPYALDVIKRLVTQSVKDVNDKVEAIKDDADYERDAPGEIEAELNVLRSQIESYDTHFARSSRALSPAIIYLLRRETELWDEQPGSVIVSIGQPKTYLTVEPAFTQTYEPERKDRILAISVPQIGGGRASWLPIVLGHEVCHYLLNHIPMPGLEDMQGDVYETIDRALIEAQTRPLRTAEGPATADGAQPESAEHDPSTPEDATPRSNPTPGLTAGQVAKGWIAELICDAFSIARFGPAGYAALAEHLGALGDPSRPPATFSHPPSLFRITLMRDWVTKGRALTADESELVERFEDLLDHEEWDDPAGNHLDGSIRPFADTIWNLTVAWMKGEPYWKATTDDRIDALANVIEVGAPPTQVMTETDVSWASPVEILNAAWRASYRTDAGYPYDALAMKALEDFHFVETWKAAGGKVDAQAPPTVTDIDDSGVLAHSALVNRLAASDTKSRLMLTPRMPHAVGDSSIDIRLGNQFIVFDRTAYPAFDSLTDDDRRPDPRSMQHKIAKAWGEVFYLHPGQLVLAAALEYLVMPEDLSAQVITRSSFGRLGLISATAVQVHPGYRGCLTLELVNLGEVPIAITPGERIAQLMFIKSSGTPDTTKQPKYKYPVGPEFSKVSTDGDWSVLHEMRSMTRR